MPSPGGRHATPTGDAVRAAVVSLPIATTDLGNAPQVANRRWFVAEAAGASRRELRWQISGRPRWVEAGRAQDTGAGLRRADPM